MSLKNAKILHKHFLEIGRKDWADQQEKNYPELKPLEKALAKEEPKAEEPKKHGKKPKR